MMFQSSKNTVAFVFVVALAFAGFACKQAATPGNQAAANAGGATAANGAAASSPTEAYKMLFAAVRAKDNQKIRQMMSKGTVALAGSAASQFGHSIEKQLENGFLETTITDTLPEMRDERVKDNFGAVEVFNKKTGKWDDTFFINEDGGWKLAVGDLFAGTYKSPGKGQAQIETEASNPMGNNMTEIKPNINGKLPSVNEKMPTASGNVKTVEVPLEKSNQKPSGKGGEKQ